jgi:hypothetical protein
MPSDGVKGAILGAFATPEGVSSCAGLAKRNLYQPRVAILAAIAYWAGFVHDTLVAKIAQFT